MLVDVHQHAWTEPLVEARARRTRWPAERLGARGGGPLDRDPLLSYDTSSYGERAIAAMAAMAEAVGAEQLVHGSDRPVVEPTVPGGGLRAGLAANAGRALYGALDVAAARTNGRGGEHQDWTARPMRAGHHPAIIAS